MSDNHVLVTGAAGFIGSHLVERLLRDGARVTGVDCFTAFYDPALKRRNLSAALAHPRFDLLEVDLGRDDLAALPEVGAVFHQAAQAGVRASWGADFASYMHHNVLATQRLLERYRDAHLERFVYASSSSVYGDAERSPTDESLLPRPFSPYGVTKLAGEHLALLYGRNFGMPVASLRYFTVYGPRQRPDMAFHLFCRALLTAQPITVYGDGRQSRDFTFVDDAVEANLRAWRRSAPQAVYNVGGGSQVELLEAIRILERVLGVAARLRFEPRPPGDPRVRPGHADRARAGRRGRVGADPLHRAAGMSDARGAAAGGTLPFLSVVVPAFNEAESLPELHRELVTALGTLGRAWEILYVDDGSRDGTDRAIETLAASDPRVRGVSLRQNFGKAAALSTAFRLVRGQWVATLDADLQDDPAELPRLVAALEGGLDLVSGWKQDRKDPLSKTLPSRLFNSVTSWAAGVRLHDFNCGFKLYRREVVDALEIYGELHRFLPALAHWKGFRVGEVPVRHRARRYGRSKYGAARFINGFLDLLSAAFISTSALKPLHVFGRIGLVFLLIGGGLGVWFVAQWFGGAPMRIRPLMLFGAGLVLLGIQFILMGLLGEMIAHLGADATYPVRRTWNLEDRA
jgi:nucleoside-diphosphate-sugar epimerase/glycosyltransferase involved in cell wall biosynthesis